jgi:thioredoxin 1
MLEAVVVLLLIASMGPPGCQKGSEPGQQNTSPSTTSTGLPRLLDLGAGKCIPCKMMAPILEELKAEYAGALEVVFIDVWQDKSAGERYRIQTIPCQIFYDASGKELFRHEGFFSKEDILSKWKELGVNLQPKGAAQSSKT